MTSILIKAILLYEIFCETMQCTFDPFLNNHFYSKKGPLKRPFKYVYVLNLTLIVMFEVFKAKWVDLNFAWFFVVSYLRIERWIVWGTQDAALFTSWLAQCATIKYTTRTGEQSCESNITKQQKNSWRCFVSRHNNEDAKRTNGKWRRNSPSTHFIG